MILALGMVTALLPINAIVRTDITVVIARGLHVSEYPTTQLRCVQDLVLVLNWTYAFVIATTLVQIAQFIILSPPPPYFP